MSYARLDSGHCDVYVFLDNRGFLACCHCGLGDDYQAYTTADMTAHLDRHRQANHLVPDYVYDELRADAEENDAWMGRTA